MRRSIGVTGVMCHMGPAPAFAVQVVGLESRRPTIRISGEVDIATAPELTDCVATVVALDPLDVVLDLNDTTFMDCSGINVIVSARRHLSEESRVVLQRPIPFIRMVLGILKIDRVAVIEE